MSKKRKEIRFLSVKEIMRYAIDTYPVIEQRTKGQIFVTYNKNKQT